MDALETRIHQMERILEISHELVGTRTLSEILRQIVDVATELIDCETAGILLLDDQPNTLRFIAVSLYQDKLFNIPVPIDASIAGAAFMSNEPVIVLDTRTDPRYCPKVAELLNYPAYSLLSVPLNFRDYKIGVLEAENKKGEAEFNQTDAQIMTALAAQATIAIENARQMERFKQLAQEEQNQRRMAEALQTASAALTSTLDYDQVIDNILEQVNLVIPNDTCNVMIIEAGGIARVFRGRGYQEIGTAKTLNDTTLNIEEVMGLRQMHAMCQPMVVPDVEQYPTWVTSRPEHNWIRSYVGAPIVMRDSVVGFLNVMSRTPNLYDQTHSEHLQAFAHHAATAIENARLYRQAQQEIAERAKIEAELRHHRDHLEELVKERTAEIHRLATIDPLTETFNRRHLMMMGSQVLKQALRYERPISILLLDIDHFKAINDTHGHINGDEALRQTARQMSKDLRSSDVLGRFGGEEFVVVMPETTQETALQIAERLRLNIAMLPITIGAKQISLTVSIGLVEQAKTGAKTLEQLIHQADNAMYTAKQAGRNQVVVYQALE